MKPLRLEDIRSTDLGATPPQGWLERKLCQLIGAKTIHWFKFVRLGRDVGGRKRWIISESIGKGTTLTFCHYPAVYVYRIKNLPDVPNLPDDIENIHAEYGELPYDWQVIFRTAAWWLLKHYLGKVIRVIKDKPVNCQEWVVLLTYMLSLIYGAPDWHHQPPYNHGTGIKLIPDDEYPMCRNLEESPYLQCLGKYNASKD